MLMVQLLENKKREKKNNTHIELEKSVGLLASELKYLKNGLVKFDIQDRRTIFDHAVRNCNNMITKILTKQMSSGILSFPSDLNLVSSIKNQTGYGNDLSFETNLFKSKLMQCDIVSMTDVRQLAENLGMIIIPLEYTNKHKIENDTFDVDNKNVYVHHTVKRFSTECENSFMTPWLVCPVSYYDIENHAKNLKYEMFTPNVAKQAFMAIKIVLPMLINIVNQLETMNKQIQNHGVDINALKNTVKEQQKQINQIQELIESEKKQRVEAELRQRELAERETQKIVQQIHWDLYDPLLIALPNNVTNINQYDDKVCLGPCWGPELDETLIELLGMDKKLARVNYVQKTYNLFKG